MPKLSVLLLNYNHAHLLPRALDAILAQSRPADEILLIDDVSTDNSLALMEEYQRRWPVVRVVRNPKNLGVLLSANQGAQAARGDWLYFAAADDQVAPGFFEQALAQAARHPSAGAVCGMMDLRTPQQKLIATMGIGAWKEAGFFPPKRVLADYFEREPAGHSLCGSTIYRRDPFLRLGGYHPGLGPWGDTFIARALALSDGLCYVPQKFMTFYVYPNSYSQRADFGAMLDVVRRAARAMRQSPFDRLFPVDHVVRWRKRYLREKVEGDIYNRGSWLQRVTAKVMKRMPVVGAAWYRAMIERRTLEGIRRVRTGRGSRPIG